METPILIPSFSSKTFPGLRKGRKTRSKSDRLPHERGYRSDLHRALDISTTFLTDTFLISAFDVHRGYLPPPREFRRVPEILFLDSGGYEIGPINDLSETDFPRSARPDWKRAYLKKIYDAWPKDLPTVLVSYDHPDQRVTLAAQIANARMFLARYPHHIHALLLKPEGEKEELLDKVIDQVCTNPAMLSGFQIVGITEKEAGTSPMKRMITIGRLRLALDAAKLINTKIHVFGALDPFATTLYFVAGAEIFDGLTWFRYGYCHGLSLYWQDARLFQTDLLKDDDTLRQEIYAANYYALQKYRIALRTLARTRNFQALTVPGSDISINKLTEAILQQASEQMVTELKRGGSDGQL